MNSSGIRLKETCANHAHSLFQDAPNAKPRTMNQRVVFMKKLKVVKTQDMSFVKLVEKEWSRFGKMENTFSSGVIRSSKDA